MYSRSAKGVEKGDPNRNPWLAKMLYHMYATTRYNFMRLKATHKISPLEELVGGRSPPQQFPEVNRYGKDNSSQNTFEIYENVSA